MRFKMFYKKFSVCESIRRKFSEYLDGTLSGEERRAVHEHLQFCNECSDQIDALLKTVSALVDFRKECLPVSIQNFRLPRSTFIEIFPTIQKQDPPKTFSAWIPYVYAVILLFLVLSSWEFAYRHTYEKFYNASNWVEVVAKI